MPCKVVNNAGNITCKYICAWQILHVFLLLNEEYNYCISYNIFRGLKNKIFKGGKTEKLRKINEQLIKRFDI